MGKTGKNRLLTQFCSDCKTRKPIKGFNINRGICADCTKKSRAATPSRKKRKQEPKSVVNAALPERPRRAAAASQAGPKTSHCPNCLLRVKVKDWTLIEHKNGRGSACRGSGHALPRPSRDAFDYRVSGNFEGGRR